MSPGAQAKLPVTVPSPTEKADLPTITRGPIPRVTPALSLTDGELPRKKPGFSISPWIECR